MFNVKSLSNILKGMYNEYNKNQEFQIVFTIKSAWVVHDSWDNFWVTDITQAAEIQKGQLCNPKHKCTHKSTKYQEQMEQRNRCKQKREIKTKYWHKIKKKLVHN